MRGSGCGQVQGAGRGGHQDQGARRLLVPATGCGPGEEHLGGLR